MNMIRNSLNVTPVCMSVHDVLDCCCFDCRNLIGDYVVSFEAINNVLIEKWGIA